MEADGERLQPHTASCICLSCKHVLSAQDFTTGHAQMRIYERSVEPVESKRYTLLADTLPFRRSERDEHQATEHGTAESDCD